MLLALSFPKYGHPAVAFIALVPLLVALRGASAAHGGFTLGLIAGFIHYAGTVYWTGATVSTFGGLPVIVAVLVAGLLALYMAAYIAVFGAITGDPRIAASRSPDCGSRRRRGSRWSTCAAS